MSIYGRSEGKRRLKNAGNKGITNTQIIDMFETLWRDPHSMRTSGFNFAGGPDAQLSFDNTTRTFKIKPKDKKFSFYQFLHKLAFFKKRDEETIQIDDIEGLHLIYYYFDEDNHGKPQKLYAVANPDDAFIEDVYLSKVIIAWIYWDAQSNRAIYFGDERHGSEWSPQIHLWAHGAFNGLHKKGLRITDITGGDGSFDADARFGISSGEFYHEDIIHQFDASLPVSGLPIFNRSGSLPRVVDNSMFPVATAPGGRIYFNSSAFGGLSKADNDSYVLCHAFATNCRIYPLIAVMGQTQYSTMRAAISSAQAELQDIKEWMPQRTRYHIGSVIFHASDQYSNTPNARIVGEVTPEQLAETVAEDVTPYIKTGWSPQVQDEVFFIFNTGYRHLTLDIQKSEVPYFVKGKGLSLKSDMPLQIANSTGLHYITGNIMNWPATLLKWDEHSADHVFVASIYFNARHQYACFVGWRMHLWEMESKTRGNILKKTGLERVSGFEVTINEDEGFEHTISVTEGSLRLADILVNVKDGGAGMFRQELTPLQARRYYLKTYLDETDPENPFFTHEWEYQHVPADYVAALSPSNEVVVNEFAEGAWMLTETANNDYSAMWLISCLDTAQPLKLITGFYSSPDLDEAKNLNTPESLRNILQAVPFIDYKDVIARIIVKNIADEPYYELIEIRDFEDGEFEKDITDRHVVDMQFDEESRELTLYRNADLPVLKVTIPGGSGDDTEPGQDGREIELDVVGGFIVWRYVGDVSWTNLISIEALKGADGVTPVKGVDYFDGENGKQIELHEIDGWVEWRYVGDASWTQLYEIPEGGGGGSDTFVVHIRFEAEGTETYTCPYACKFTTIKYSQASAPELSVALDTNMAEYDDLEITAESGLITLTGVWL